MSSGVTNREASRPPGKLNVKTGPPLLTFCHVVLFRLLFFPFFVVFSVFFLAGINIHDTQTVTIIS